MIAKVSFVAAGLLLRSSFGLEADAAASCAEEHLADVEEAEAANLRVELLQVNSKHFRGAQTADEVTAISCDSWCTNVGAAVWSSIPNCKDCKSSLLQEEGGKEGCDSYCGYVGASVQGN
eukprot:CAMPEP_0197621790 /NCGR_PEP_ID=MMETSP1338-20131121/2254_1 /TAXON_ID=43686 ORGANISM="Pelagodinium beii, Strain RCC1491" /NCGR_SAMPLE_ID=MMETSP1338 /ASSEMBLY_ACC=CAM_ASM_000754 /LENGTH=119 /DNA_ID=CAMNT_0043191331 /DNA_START=77 /DNA_END=433 /DNA_ORIENTATION=+